MSARILRVSRPVTAVPVDETRQAPAPASAPSASRRRRLAVRLAKGALWVALGYYVACVALLVVYRFVPPPMTGLQLQRCIEAWFGGDRCVQQIRHVAYSTLPEHVGRAVVAAEDGRFWNHWGFDLEEMKDAATEVFDGDMPRGASTITQQLMKNLFGGAGKNPVRKLYDVALTLPAELILPKERILELYLNNVEWAPSVYGVDAAARYHYGTRARNLSRSQAAGLAALLPNPLRRTPENTPRYRAEILRRMSHRGW